MSISTRSSTSTKASRRSALRDLRTR
jgi:hypothetical protein